MKYDKNGLIPAIIQDSKTGQVLMLGYINEESWRITLESKRVTFWSRSRQSLWTKGGTSGNYLNLVDWALDCDEDTLLIRVRPDGPTCHKGDDTCWAEKNVGSEVLFLDELSDIISSRQADQTEGSYTASLFRKGINKIAQKVGEEAVELVIEAKDDDEQLFLGEAADLMFHYLVLLRAKGHDISDVIQVLKSRHKPN
ncbi:MAG: bifunctional phosphoribosyl-AMP cyclohydrolase/phosphoribosyl-ATP diphosphatase HisIE [Bacteroidota bacterium]